MYIGYQQFIFWYLVEEGLRFTFISLLSFRGPHTRSLKGHTVAYLSKALHFKPKCREFESRYGYWEYSMTNSFRPHCGTGVDTDYETNLLSTAGTALLFTESVKSTNITVYILQCVTVMNQETLQHFPTSSTSAPLSPTRLHLKNGLV